MPEARGNDGEVHLGWRATPGEGSTISTLYHLLGGSTSCNTSRAASVATIARLAVLVVRHNFTIAETRWERLVLGLEADGGRGWEAVRHSKHSRLPEGASFPLILLIVKCGHGWVALEHAFRRIQARQEPPSRRGRRVMQATEHAARKLAIAAYLVKPIRQANCDLDLGITEAPDKKPSAPDAHMDARGQECLPRTGGDNAVNRRLLSFFSQK